MCKVRESLECTGDVVVDERMSPGAGGRQAYTRALENIKQWNISAAKVCCLSEVAATESAGPG